MTPNFYWGQPHKHKPATRNGLNNLQIVVVIELIQFCYQVNPYGLNVNDPQFLLGATAQPQTNNPERVE